MRKSERIGSCFQDESHLRGALLPAGPYLAPAVTVDLASIRKVTHFQMPSSFITASTLHGLSKKWQKYRGKSVNAMMS